MSLDRIVDTLTTLVAFETTSRHSILPLIEWVEETLCPLGFACERIPGSIEQAHTADEWIELAELQRCAAFVERLIERCRE